MNVRAPILVPFLLLILGGCTQSAQKLDTLPPEPPSSLQRAAIQQALLHATSANTSDTSPVKLEQIALDADYALVTWTRGEMGGQALLRWEEGSWNVLLSEPGWLGLRGLVRQGVPEVVARSLLEQIDPNWPSYERF